MSLRFYNTLTQEKEQFAPVVPGHVGIYLCGPTVYKESHIGHAVGPVVFDALRRYLQYKGFKVTFVINITDVEDKLIAEAHKAGCGVYELAVRVTQSYLDSLAKLGVGKIDHLPRASEHIQEIIEMIKSLIDRGFAYTVGGDVYFDVIEDKEYGKLSNRKPEEQTGQRDLASQEKRNTADFALWKSAKPDEPEDVCFDSPWGRGRPGWHIECSAMSMKYLGESFDIHGGGMDLIFPHHENEIAQSECCTGKPFAKYWLHNGLTRVNTKKLSKSDPQMQETLERMTLRNLLRRHSGEMLRFFILSTHYRRPIEFSDEELASKKKGLDGFYRFFERVEQAVGESPYQDGPNLCKPKYDDYAEEHHDCIDTILEFRGRFFDALDDDFNTAGALAVMFQLTSHINKYMDQHAFETQSDEKSKQIVLAVARTLREDGRLLGLFEKPPEKVQLDSLTPQLLDLLIQLRKQCKKDKNYEVADRIRDGLASINIQLEDRPDGTQWRLLTEQD